MTKRLDPYPPFAGASGQDVCTHTSGIFHSHIEIPSKPIYGDDLSRHNVCFAALSLCILSPVMVIIAIAVKLSSDGTIFYRGERAADT